MGRPAKYNWEAIKLDYESGLAQSEIHKKHNVPYNRLSERVKEWEVSEEAKSIIRGFDEVSEAVTELSGTKPEVAENVIDIIGDKHPQFKKAMVALSGAIFKRGMEIAPQANATDLNALSKAMQTTTDTLGISQRHAPKIDVTQQTAVSSNETTKIVVLEDKQ